MFFCLPLSVHSVHVNDLLDHFLLRSFCFLFCVWDGFIFPCSRFILGESDSRQV